MIDHRQVAEAVLGHDRHHVVDGVRRRDGAHVLGHELTHLGIPRGQPLDGHFPGIVALGEDAYQASAFERQHGADVMLGHHLQRFQDGGVR